MPSVINDKKRIQAVMLTHKAGQYIIELVLSFRFLVQELLSDLKPILLPKNFGKSVDLLQIQNQYGNLYVQVCVGEAVYQME